FLLVHGDENTLVACSHSESLGAALEQARVPAWLWKVTGADHGWCRLPDAQVEEIFNRSLAFARHLVTSSPRHLVTSSPRDREGEWGVRAKGCLVNDLRCGRGVVGGGGDRSPVPRG
ncbi:alpha/beta hydrolase family protein, partial [Streptomyces sp. NPDC058247]|uniref:alpha/beta hydrolase family protein n=1 Tax=Streptomyces sp. NPDC058247 TaxID=3346401 RepID=UPI0036E07001